MDKKLVIAFIFLFIIICTVLGVLLWHFVFKDSSDDDDSTLSSNSSVNTQNKSTVNIKKDEQTSYRTVVDTSNSTGVGTGVSNSTGVGTGVVSSSNRKTVKDMLIAKCPVRADAGDKINPGNSATYNDYLFSGCTTAGTCDSINDIDEISERIINMTSNEHCGAWNLMSDPDQIQIVYNNDTKWRRLNTVRDKLQFKCPVRADAGDKIVKDNSAKYTDYLFSGCTAAGTCDSTGDPDPISNRIINMSSNENCGSWDLSTDPNKIQIVYNNQSKSWNYVS